MDEAGNDQRFKLVRDVTLLLAGVGMLAYEVILGGGNERPMLLVLFASMMGLPMMLRKDERSNG